MRVKAAYQDVLEKLLGLLQADLSGPDARERALSLVALCVGGMVAATQRGGPGPGPGPAPRRVPAGANCAKSRPC